LKAAGVTQQEKGKSRSKARPQPGRRPATLLRRRRPGQAAPAGPRLREHVRRRRLVHPWSSTGVVVPVRRVRSPRPSDEACRSRSRRVHTAGSLDAPVAREQRRPALTSAPVKQPVVVVPEFAEAGVLLAITYSIREGRRGEFFDLMRELKPLLHAIGGGDVAIYEDRSRPNYLMEVFPLQGRAGVHGLRRQIPQGPEDRRHLRASRRHRRGEKSDFKIFERRCSRAPGTTRARGRTDAITLAHGLAGLTVHVLASAMPPSSATHGGSE